MRMFASRFVLHVTYMSCFITVLVVQFFPYTRVEGTIVASVLCLRPLLATRVVTLRPLQFGIFLIEGVVVDAHPFSQVQNSNGKMFKVEPLGWR